MRVLWIPSPFPYPPNDGNRQRHLHLVRETARRHDVAVLGPSDLQADHERAVKDVGADVIRAGPQRRKRGRVAAMARREPRCIVPDNIAGLVPCAVEQRREYDVAVGALYVAPAVLAARAPVALLDALNIEGDLYRQLWRNERPSARKLARLMDWRSVQAFERRWLRRADAVTVCSGTDVQRIPQIVPDVTNLHLIPNGVDLDAVSFHNGPRDPKAIVFIGGMSYTPNVEAARVLVCDVLPVVWQTDPQVTAWLVGKNPSPEVRSLASDRVVVTGEVPSVLPVLARAALAVVPLRSGGGTRLKILEAMAAGTPVVTTAIGAEGLGLAHRREAWICSTTDDVAQAICTCLESPDLTRRMASNARRRVEADYDWTKIGSRFVAALEGLAS